jgi:hypothetical protein
MLDLSTAVLCDFAQVRDRLLFVSSGAVSRLYRQELPSPLGLMVGLVIEVPLEDAGMDHRLRAEVINRHGTVLATLENLFRVSDAGLFPHEVQQVPLVLSITGVRARTWGTHQVRLYLDDELVRALTLYVVPAAGPQAVRPAPTQSRASSDIASLGGTGTEGVEAPGEEPAAEGRDEAGEWGGQPQEEQPSFALSDDEPESTTIEARPTPAGAAPAFQPDPDPEPAGTPAFPTATIAAEPAEPAQAPEAEAEAEAEAQVFDFEDAPVDDEGAGEDVGEDDEAEQEKSRFAFRYRYEDDET